MTGRTRWCAQLGVDDFVAVSSPRTVPCTSKLSFEWADRPTGANQNSVRFHAVVVDGIRLEEHIQRRAGQTFDYVSPFGWLAEAFEREVVAPLLTTSASELASGRVPIMICPECADLGCGCVSVAVVVSDTQVRWTEFAYENNYAPEDARVLEGMPVFSFDRASHRAALDSIRRWPA